MLVELIWSQIGEFTIINTGSLLNIQDITYVVELILESSSTNKQSSVDGWPSDYQVSVNDHFL